MLLATHGIIASSRRAASEDPVLTIVVNGLDDDYEVAVDDVVWPNNQMSFPLGTELTDVTPTIFGWALDPLSEPSVIMDMSKSISFDATMVFVLLSGATRSNLVAGWTESPTNVFTRSSTGSDDLAEKLTGDGWIGMQFRASADAGIYLADAPLGSQTDYIGILFIDGIAYREDNTSATFPLSTQPKSGEYVVIRKISDVVDIALTEDGVTFNSVYTWGTKAYEDILLYGLNSNIMYDPQGKDLSSGGGPVVLDWNLNSNLTIENTNDFVPIGGDARGWTVGHIPPGGVGELRGRSYITIFGLDPDSGAIPYQDVDYGVWRSASGNAGTFNSNASTEDVAVPEGTYLRVRCDGTQIHQEYSLDNGATWTHLISPVAQPAVNLYGKVTTDPGEHLDDVLGSGFIV